MLSRILFIGSLILLGYACKKVDYSVNADEHLTNDTASVIHNAFYVSHSPNLLTVRVEMATFVGTSTLSDYSSFEFGEDSLTTSEYSIEWSPKAQYSPSETDYSTVLLLNKFNAQFMYDYHMGVYLDYYLNQTTGDQNAKTAFASFEQSNDDFTFFHIENSSSIFDNSVDYTLGNFYNGIRNSAQGNSTSNTDLAYAIKCLDETIDTLIADPQATGKLSITMLNGDGFHGGTFPEIEIANIITKAQNNNVSINVIGAGNHIFLNKIAHETGGFIFDLDSYLYNINDDQYHAGSHKFKVGVIVQNLEKLLSGNFDYTSSLASISNLNGTFSSGNHLSFAYTYNEQYFKFTVTIP